MKKISIWWCLALLLLVLALAFSACDGGETPSDGSNDGSNDLPNGEVCTEHSFGEWVTDAAATCAAYGKRHRVCTVCQTTERETLPKDPAAHHYSSERAADDTYIYFPCTNAGCKQRRHEREHHMIFSVSNGRSTLTKYIGNEDSAILPSTYNGAPVTSIGEGAFLGSLTIKSVTIPDSVTSIEKNAFFSCPRLSSVIMGEGVANIGDSAFRDCAALATVTLPDGIEYVGREAFTDCTALTYYPYDNAYYLGNSKNPYVYLVKAESFGVTSCTVHEDTRYIGEYAFAHCAELTSVTLGGSITYIAERACYGCSSLTTIHYGGTKVEWRVTFKGFFWNEKTPTITVKCTDGDLTVS